MKADAGVIEFRRYARGRVVGGAVIWDRMRPAHDAMLMMLPFFDLRMIEN
jgi:hypothetical protein